MRTVQWKGVYPAVTTKFTEAEELDIPAFLVNLREQVAAGVEGIIVGGSLGESSTLSQDERVVLAKAALEDVGEKVDIILNVAEGSTRDAIATRDISNVTRLRNRFGDRYKILCGVDTLAMEEIVMGADGWVAGLVCAFPRETVAIYKLVKAGRIEQARDIYRWFMPILELDINPQLVQNIKLAEVMTGIGTEHVRAPRHILVGDERKRVIGILEEGLSRRPTLPEYLSL